MVISHSLLNIKNPTKTQVTLFFWGWRSYKNKSMQLYHKDRNFQDIIAIHYWLDKWILEVTKQSTGFFLIIWTLCLANFTSSILPIYSTSSCQTERNIKGKPLIFYGSFMSQRSRKYWRESDMSHVRELFKDGHWKHTND